MVQSYLQYSLQGTVCSGSLLTACRGILQRTLLATWSGEETPGNGGVSNRSVEICMFARIEGDLRETKLGGNLQGQYRDLLVI